MLRTGRNDVAMKRSLPVLLVLPLIAGCYPVRNPVAPGPGADTALNGRIAAPVRDPADDPDTASPVERNDAPGDAGTYSPGSNVEPGGFGAEAPRIGPSPAVLDARRSVRDGDVGGAAELRQRQAEQRRELDNRRRIGENPATAS